MLADDSVEEDYIVKMNIDANPLQKNSDPSSNAILHYLTHRLKPLFLRLMQTGAFTHGASTLKFKFKVNGEAPPEGYAVFIGLHDDNTAEYFNREAANDTLWKELYDKYTFPRGSVWIALRAPTDTAPLWVEASIAQIIDKFIAQLVMTGGVDPNRIFLLGEGMGATAACTVGAALAYRFAGILAFSGYGFSLMLSTASVPVYIDGLEEEPDGAKRVSLCKYEKQFEVLGGRFPGEYEHVIVRLPPTANPVAERSAAIEKMMLKQRTPLPGRVIWLQSDYFAVASFYWVAVPQIECRPDTVIVVTHTAANEFRIQTNHTDTIILRLNKYMIDLSKKVKIYCNEGLKFFDFLNQNKDMSTKTSHEFSDPYLTFSIEQAINVNEPKIII